MEASTRDLFLVDWWISYDIRDLSPLTPNAAPRTRLTLAEQNDPANAIDLAVGLNLFFGRE